MVIFVHQENLNYVKLYQWLINNKHQTRTENNLLMQQYDHEQILKLEKRFRTNLINSLSGFKAANLVATINTAGLTNMAIFSSAVHIGANPPLLGLVSRPHSVPRHTLENIMATEQFTINHVNSMIYKQAHQTSARYRT